MWTALAYSSHIRISRSASLTLSVSNSRKIFYPHKKLYQRKAPTRCFAYLHVILRTTMRIAYIQRSLIWILNASFSYENCSCISEAICADDARKLITIMAVVMADCEIVFRSASTSFQYNNPQDGFNPQGGGYAAPPGAFPPQNAQVSPDAQRWFAMVDRDRSGKINATELQAALVNGRGEHFSDNACKLMISMFDQDASSTIDIYEFEKLYQYINQWLQVFKTYDRDNSGHIEEQELTNAFQQMGFRFSPDFIKFLLKKSDPQNQKEISVDQFIVLCVQIQRFTEASRQRDTQQTGTITIGFEDFLSVAIGCSY